MYTFFFRDMTIFMTIFRITAIVVPLATICFAPRIFMRPRDGGAGLKILHLHYFKAAQLPPAGLSKFLSNTVLFTAMLREPHHLRLKKRQKIQGASGFVAAFASMYLFSVFVVQGDQQLKDHGIGSSQQDF